jgi:PAS domain S-box-containing protein
MPFIRAFLVYLTLVLSRMEKTKAALLREIEALNAKNAVQEAEIAELKKKVDDQQLMFLKALTESNQIAQQRLAEIENIYKTSSVGLAVLDPDARYLKVNDKLALINAVSVEDHIGKTVSQIFPAAADTVQKIISEIVRTGQPLLGIEFEVETPGQPGVSRYFSEDWLPLRDESGRITAFNVAIVETTELKQANEEILEKHKLLLASKRALERSQRKLHLALENGKIGLWELDLATNVFTVDDRMVQMFDMQTHIHSMEDLDVLIHEEDVQYVKDALQNTLILENKSEIVFRTNPRAGTIRHISSRAIIGRDRKGVPVKIIGVCFDITNFARETEKNLLKLNEELQRSNKDLDQFAHIASHDLQEPLRMIASFTQLLQMKYAAKLDIDANEYINYAVDGSKRMYELLNGLLAYSRVHSKGSAFAPADMNHILNVVLENLRLSIEEKGAQVIASHLPSINADGNQMMQILQNLIGNALKFNRSKPVIHLSYADMDKFHSFSVMDNGIGIEKQYHDKIFKIFQRLHGNEYDGTGVGLPVCKRIAERHGGRIWVESKPGEGSVFTFTILKDLK